MRIYAKRNRIQRETSEDQVHTQLEVGQPDDQYEKEADATADQVMRMPSGVTEEDKVNPMTSRSAVQKQSEEEAVQMMTDKEESLQMQPEEEDSIQMMPEEERVSNKEEESVQMATDEESIQMQPEEEQVSMQEDDEKISMKGEGAPVQQAGGGKQVASQGLANQISSTKGAGRPLASGTQQELGSKMGANFSGVRVHTGSQAIEMNNQLGAKAFAHGQDIYFNQGNYDPGSSKGKHLLAHELTHVMQQRGKETIQKQEDQDPPKKKLISKQLKGDEKLEKILNGDGSLRKGNSGDHIRKLQEALIKAGIEVEGGATGTFNEATKKAVIAFQDKRMVLDKYQDGVVGPVTLELLDKYNAYYFPDSGAELVFNGSQISWMIDGVAVFTYPAVSGLKKHNPAVAKLIKQGRTDIKKGVDYTDSKYQNVAGAGPIPKGNYSLSLEKSMPFQKSDGGWGVGGWKLNYNNSAYQIYADLGSYFEQNWARNGFFLHHDGGNDGTAGCIGISLGANVLTLQKVLSDYFAKDNSSIKVRVEY